MVVEIVEQREAILAADRLVELEREDDAVASMEARAAGRFDIAGQRAAVDVEQDIAVLRGHEPAAGLGHLCAFQAAREGVAQRAFVASEVEGRAERADRDVGGQPEIAAGVGIEVGRSRGRGLSSLPIACAELMCSSSTTFDDRAGDGERQVDIGDEHILLRLRHVPIAIGDTVPEIGLLVGGRDIEGRVDRPGTVGVEHKHAIAVRMHDWRAVNNRKPGRIVERDARQLHRRRPACRSPEDWGSNTPAFSGTTSSAPQSAVGTSSAMSTVMVRVCVFPRRPSPCKLNTS